MPRLFVSVDVPEEGVAELRELHTRLRETDADLNLVDPEKTHVTLKFLGETDEDAVGEIEDVVEGVTESGR
ncbi:MAG: 2'-5' RNA ligase family protein, partial [Halobacteria archaeon]|nr:2'-5' RNA ligase family protein [Halobacteria archaeon]